MANVTKHEVQKLARLANLKLSSLEVEKYSRELSPVVSYIAQLREVNTESVLDHGKKHELVNVTREDLVVSIQNLSQEKALSQAKVTHNGMFVVDRVIED